jgi:anti-sigma-K factor RskA
MGGGPVSETHASIHALSGAYAIDALDDIERTQFEHHLSTCAECRIEVAELQATAAALAEDAAAPPPANLRGRVLTDIAAVRPQPPEVTADVTPEAVAGPRPARRTGRRVAPRERRTRLAVAAAAVVALGAGGAMVWTQLAEPTSQGTPSAIDKVLRSDDAERATVEFLDGAQATLVRSESLGQAVLTTTELPDPPSGKAYQMWLLTDDGNLAPAGMMKPVTSQTVLLDGDASQATAAAISIEPAGGSRQPTTDPIALIDFKQLEDS